MRRGCWITGVVGLVDGLDLHVVLPALVEVSTFADRHPIALVHTYVHGVVRRPLIDDKVVHRHRSIGPSVIVESANVNHDVRTLGVQPERHAYYVTVIPGVVHRPPFQERYRIRAVSEGIRVVPGPPVQAVLHGQQSASLVISAEGHRDAVVVPHAEVRITDVDHCRRGDLIDLDLDRPNDVHISGGILGAVVQDVRSGLVEQERPAVHLPIPAVDLVGYRTDTDAIAVVSAQYRLRVTGEP
ncbi:MAG: hypothetical protein A4E30_00245 [Methanomassiliicoccales archaeon PtaB.Bin215]|nr:MAG: hypothetical protein A4E30_00245 [Methanomassiliicoccales archaeon PtaB.Bin215]